MQSSIKEIIEEIKNKKKTLYILCGLPYSGKTYFANEIMKEINIEYISIDNIFKEFGYSWDSNNLPNEKGWSEIFIKSYTKTQEALNKSNNVLYDSTNHTRISRDKLREIAQEMGAETNVVFIDVPIPVIYDRWENNKLNQTRAIISRELIDDTIYKFEKPKNDESVLLIDCSVK